MLNQWQHNFFPKPNQLLTPFEYRQFMLLSVITPIGAFILSFFAIWNAFVLERPFIAWVSIMTAITLAIAHFYFRYHQKTTLPIVLILSGFIGFLFAFNYQNQNLGFGLVWTILFPIIALVSAGRFWGTLISGLLFVIMLPLLVSGLNLWLNGLWDTTGILRFSFAYLFVTYIVYTLEVSNESSYHRLQAMRDKENEHLALLETMAITDPLTKAYNRHFLNQISQTLSDQMKQQQKTLLFAIIDLDWFKAYNDAHGHTSGDSALQQISALLQKELEKIKGDLFRVGGEEFAIIALTDQPDQALEKMQTLNAKVQQLCLKHPHSPFEHMTLSGGLVITDDADHFHFDHYYKTADAALYQAKAQGRNQLIILDHRQH